jgi:hypothetical protein
MTFARVILLYSDKISTYFWRTCHVEEKPEIREIVGNVASVCRGIRCHTDVDLIVLEPIILNSIKV